MWPRRGRDLSQGDVDAFLKLARGWHVYLDRPDAMNLAIRRLAASFSRPGGRFGQEDRVLDVAIALEVLYGGTTGHKLAQRAAALLGGSATEQKHRYDQAKGFYDLRSSIVHWKNVAYSRDVLGEELEAGRDLACLTLMSLLDRGEPPKWGGCNEGPADRRSKRTSRRRGTSGISDLGVRRSHSPAGTWSNSRRDRAPYQRNTWVAVPSALQGNGPPESSQYGPRRPGRR